MSLSALPPLEPSEATPTTPSATCRCCGRLSFYEQPYRRYVLDGLVELPGQGAVLKDNGLVPPLPDFPGAAIVLEEKRQIGSALHRAVEIVCRGEEPQAVHERVKPYLDCFLRWWTSLDRPAVETELLRFSAEHRVATSVDLDFVSWPRCVELKTTARRWPHHRLQAAINGICAAADSAAVLYLEPKLKRGYDEVEATPRDFKDAEAACAMYWRRREPK